MTGQQFRTIRTRFGASAREFLSYVDDKHGIKRSETSLYQMEDRPDATPMAERWVKYLREYMGAETFNKLVEEINEGAKK